MINSTRYFLSDTTVKDWMQHIIWIFVTLNCTFCVVLSNQLYWLQFCDSKPEISVKEKCPPLLFLPLPLWGWHEHFGFFFFSTTAAHSDTDLPYSPHPTWFICPFCVLNCIRPKRPLCDLSTYFARWHTFVCHLQTFVICFLTLPFITPRDENVKQMTSLPRMDFFLPTRTLNLIKKRKKKKKKKTWNQYLKKDTNKKRCRAFRWRNRGYWHGGKAKRGIQ